MKQFAAALTAVICMALTAPVLVLSQSSPPDTPAGRRLAEWIGAVNRGDAPATEDFLRTAFMAPRDPAGMRGLREQSGGFDLDRVQEFTATRIVALLKARVGGEPAQLTLEVEADEPHRITSIGVRPVTPVESAAPASRPQAVSRLPEGDAVMALRAECETRASQDRFSGAVLLAKGERILFTHAYGLADREGRLANQIDTKFRLGSMNKMFTAVAVAQLAQAGRLHFDDHVGKYLPDYLNTDVASKVTVHDLLTHTGGTGDIFGPEYDRARERLRNLADYVTLYGARGLEFEPGARWSYSNYGFILLGRIVEQVSGQSYYDYVREHICKPATMTSTDSFPETARVPQLAVGYMRADGGSSKPNTLTLPPRGTSAGGGYSTVTDLSRFARALLGHSLLNAEYTNLVTTGKVETGPGGRYGYGFGTIERFGTRWFGHNGGAPGMNGELRIFPDSGYIVAVLANIDPPAAGQVADFISARLPVR
jgi:CubicO group peptidase (beta-lactamase class C family)